MIDPHAARARLTTGPVDAFDHEAHVKAAYSLLKERPFLEAAEIYAAGLQALAEEAGVPEKFNMTVTLAFLSAIAEHLASHPRAHWRDFIGDNPALLDKGLLLRWYEPQRLWSDAAREIFLMPEAAI